jgi:5-methylcytosine-specific restriction protein A
MAGAKDFLKGLRGIKSCQYQETKKKKEISGFDKYRIYNTSRWSKIRTKVLLTHPVCQVCDKELATQVDHIIPFSTGMTDAQKLRLGFDVTNLQSICTDCHLEKHNKKKIDKGNEI